MTRAGALILFLAAIAIPFKAFAFVYIVDSTADAIDSNTGDGICRTLANTCTLRAAIQQANAWPGGHIIVIPAGIYALTIPRAITGDPAASGDLDIAANLIIRGAGAGATIIDGGGIDRVFHIPNPDAVVDIAGVTIRNGSALPQATPSDNGAGGGILNSGTLTLSDSIVSNNKSSPIGGLAGGGIYHAASGVANVSLLLNRVTVSNNTADNTAITGAKFPVSGGGIAIQNGAIQILNSIISGNVAHSDPAVNQPNLADGGGIEINSGVVTIADSTISGNVADMHGGGISNFSGGGQTTGGTLTITRSTISDNQAYLGGGIYDDGSASRTLTMLNSTVSGNLTQAPAGFTATPASGGGLFISKPAILLNSTISNNSAVDGGGIYLDPVGISLNQGRATLKHTIIANQASGIDCSGAVANITSSGHNIASDATCNLGGTGDRPSTAPQLAALAAGRGGPTAVHVPQTGSPAIDNGDNANCPTSDQRGFPRPVAVCDIGSVEVTPGTHADLAVILTGSPGATAVGATLTYAVNTINQGPNDATGVQLSLTLPAGVSFQSAPGCTQAAGVVSCSIGALAAGATATRSIAVSPTTAASLTATATASAAQNDPNPANNTNIPLVTASYAPTDLVITTTAQTSGIVAPAAGGADTTGPIQDGDTVIAGQSFTYTLTIGNTTVTARNVRIVDTLPAGVNFVSVTPSTGSCTAAARVITCALGDLPVSGSAATIAIVAMPAVKGLASNEAVGNFDGAFLTAPPRDDFAVNIEVRADLEVQMVASSNPVVVGANLGYIVSLTNHGPSDSANPQLVVSLDPSVTYESSSGSEWSCTPASSTVTCTRATFAANATSTVTLFVVPTATGTVTTTAAFNVAAGDKDLVQGNNTATATTTVIAGTVVGPNLSVTLNATPNPGTTGNDLSFVSTIVNSGNDTASRVVLTQALPAGVAFTSGTSGCNRSGNFVQCTVGTIISGTSASVTVVVRPGAAGDISSSVTALDSGGHDPDLTDNTASITLTVNAAPGSGLRKGSGCFIATAAYGSYLDPHVRTLRRFRDNYLLTNAPGRVFVDWYYETSPPIAAFISEHESLRLMTRWALTPIVYGIEYPAPFALIGIAVFAMTYRRRGQP